MDSNNLIFGRKTIFDNIRNKKNIFIKVFVDKTITLSSEEKTLLDTVKFEYVSKEKFENLSLESNTQGVFAQVKEYNYVPFEEMLSKGYKNIVVLDKIQDPHNFGAIIRSAVSFGIQAIVIMNVKQVQVTPTVYKTSVGSVFDIDICKVSNINMALDKLKKNGYWVYTSTLSDDSVKLKDVNFGDKNVVVLGNEGDGVSELVVKNSDMKFIIPMTGKVDSLNVSVAAGIIFSELFSKK